MCLQYGIKHVQSMYCDKLSKFTSKKLRTYTHENREQSVLEMQEEV